MRASWIVSLGIVVIVCGVAGCRPPVAAAPKVPPASPTGPIVLESGVRLELVAVSDDFAERSWKPDGTALDEWVVPTIFKGAFEGTLTKPTTNPGRERSFAVRVDGVSDESEPSLAFRVGDGGEIRLPGYTALEGIARGGAARYWLSGVAQEMGAKSTSNLRVGLAAGPWETVSAYKNDGAKFVLDQGSAFPMFVMPEGGHAQRDAEGHTIMGGFSVTVEFPNQIARRAFRLIAVDSKGKEMGATGSMTELGKTVPLQYYFGGKISDLHRIELQIRDYTWTEFKNLRLDPVSAGA